jgi:hypothetical protein
MRFEDLNFDTANNAAHSFRLLAEAARTGDLGVVAAPKAKGGLQIMVWWQNSVVPMRKKGDEK